MDFQVVFSENALAELEEILAVVSEAGPHAAGKFYKKLRQKALSVGKFPRRHAAVVNRANVRKFPVGSYTIYYRVNDAKRRVTILHFWHGARRPPVF